MAEVADHFYTTDPNGEIAQTSGYIREGIAFFAFPIQQEGTVPWFRLFGNGDHFYTTDSGETDFAVSVGYEREGISAFVFPSVTPGSVPIFRWWKGGSQPPEPLPPDTGNEFCCTFFERGQVRSRRTIRANSLFEASMICNSGAGEGGVGVESGRCDDF